MTELEESGPWITFAAIEWLEAILRPGHRVFEWGSGTSTVWFAERVAHIVSVESDHPWFHEISKRLSDQHLENAAIMYIPESTGWQDYSSIIHAFAKPFDLVFIDGHLATRTICASAAIKVAGPETVIMLDNSDTMVEAASLLKVWAAEHATFYGAGCGKKKWATTFYYPNQRRTDSEC